jgi:hypothetical protein
MECQEIKNKLQELVDNSLEIQEVTAIKNHLRSCCSCTADYRLLNLVAQSVKALPLPQLSPEFNANIFNALGLEYKVPRLSPVLKWATGAVVSLSSLWLVIFGLGLTFGLNKLDPFKIFSLAKDFIKAPPNLQVILVKAGLRLADMIDLLGQVAATLLKGSNLPVQLAIASIAAFAIIAVTSKRIYINSKI